MLKHDNSSQSVEISLTLKRKQLRSCFSSLTLLSVGTDKVSRTMGTAQAAKWKAMKKSFVSHQVDSLRQHYTFVRTTWLITLKDHPSPLRHDWELASGHCRAVCHTRPTLPTQLPEPELSEDSTAV